MLQRNRVAGAARAAFLHLGVNLVVAILVAGLVFGVWYRPPFLLAEELEQIGTDRRYPIYITHTKPAETGLIMEEIRRFDVAPKHEGASRHDIRWLSAGQTFDL